MSSILNPGDSSNNGRWRQWWEKFKRDLQDTANPNSTHTEEMSPADVQRQATFESLDYYKSYPDIYIEHLREHHRRRRVYLQNRQSEAEARERLQEAEANNADIQNSSFLNIPNTEEISAHFNQLSVVQDEEERHVALRWLLHVLIAVSVGVVATLVSYGVNILEEFRENTLRSIVSVHFFGLGYLAGLFFWVFAAAVLSAMAAAVVVFFEPAASGGGIPDIMAYLNGVHLRRAMNFKTFVAKALSCIFAVASGMPVGLEAPLIHLGGITGAGVTQGRSRTLGFQTSLFQSFRSNKDRRDFITAGAACGVSAAFGAPIGGLLFVMEEVSSFWDHTSSGQIFLATMICFTVTTIINSIVEDQRFLGYVSNAASVLFEVNITIPLNLISILPALILGAVLGGLAALFTKSNIILTKWRRKKLKPYPIRRFLEPIVLAAVFTAVTYTVTLLSDCRTVKNIAEMNETILVWGTEEPARLFNATCSSPDTYSPFGSLGLATGKNVIRHLFTRQTAAEFPIYYLALFFIVYFVFACLCSGTAVSGGLVVPSLVIGAIFGRLYGLFLWYVGVRSAGIERGYWSTDAWMDPGLFALIGAGAFLAGTSRMAMSICVIMVELSSELHYLLPVMVAIVMSKTVADWLSEPLYHHMLHMDCVPYLEPNLTHLEFEQLTAADVMSNTVTSFSVIEKTSVILDALKQTTHNAFPVLESSRDSDEVNHQKFIGVVTREDLQVYFALPQFQDYNPDEEKEGGSTVGSSQRNEPISNLPGCIQRINQMTWSEWVAHKSSLFLGQNDRFEWIRNHVPEPPGERRAFRSKSGSSKDNTTTVTLASPADDFPPFVDLSLIVNRSPWCVPPFFNLQMTYQTFRRMGLRHMIVVDGEQVKGVITRKDLLTTTLLRRMKELRERIREQENEGGSIAPTALLSAKVRCRTHVNPGTQSANLISRSENIREGREAGGGIQTVEEVVTTTTDAPQTKLASPTSNVLDQLFK